MISLKALLGNENKQKLKGKEDKLKRKEDELTKNKFVL